MNSIKHYAERDGIPVKMAQRRRAAIGIGELANPNNRRSGYMVTEKQWIKILATCEIYGWKPKPKG